MINSIFLPDINQRKFPFLISIGIYALILFKIIPYSQTIELYYYFVGLLASTFAALLLILLKFKASIHLLGMGSLLMFLIALSIHFQKNITLIISILTFLTGLVATARLYLRAHSKLEVVVGLMTGIFCQLFTVKFWL